MRRGTTEKVGSNATNHFILSNRESNAIEDDDIIYEFGGSFRESKPISDTFYINAHGHGDSLFSVNFDD